MKKIKKALEKEKKAQLSKLAEIDQALANLISGDFGLCMNCKANISVERLLRVPTTKLCEKCSDN